MLISASGHFHHIYKSGLWQREGYHFDTFLHIKWDPKQWGCKGIVNRTQELIVFSSFRCTQHPMWSWSPGPELTICQTRTRTRQKVSHFILSAECLMSIRHHHLLHRQGVPYVQVNYSCSSWISPLSPLCRCNPQPKCYDMPDKKTQWWVILLTWARWDHPEAPANSP